MLDWVNMTPKSSEMPCASRRYAGLQVFLAGLLLPAAYAPIGLWPLAIVSVAWLFWVWAGDRPLRAALHGWLFAMGCYLTGAYWIEIGIHNLARLNHITSLYLFLLFCSFLALYHAVCGLISVWLGRKLSDPARWLSLYPASYVLCEMIRGRILNGFPWLQLGTSQIDSPLSGFAPIGGVYVESLLVCVSGGLLLVLAMKTTFHRGAACVLLFLVWGAGAVLSGHCWTRPDGGSMHVAVVQGNYPLERRWHHESLPEIEKYYLSLTRALPGRYDLILWPEAAIPASLLDLPDFLRSLRDYTDSSGAHLLVGALSFHDLAPRNAAILIGADTGLYDKRRLVPFFEFIPDVFRPILRAVEFTPPSSHLAEGTSPPHLEMNGVRIGISICYEDAYTHLILDAADNTRLLVNLSNDGWFGDTSGPGQHLQIARQRALETGRYMVRATNTGFSAMIAPDGRVLDKTSLFTTTYLEGSVPTMAGATPYARLGLAPTCVVILVLLAIVILSASAKKREALSLPQQQ